MKKLSYNITALSLLILSFTCEAAFPIITLNGNADTTINIYSSYIDEGATAIDAEDGNITAAIIVYGAIDTSNISDYLYTYIIQDNDGNSDTTTRIVRVRDLEKPELTYLGIDSFQIEKDSSFSSPGVTVTDNYDTSIYSSLQYATNLDTSITGYYWEEFWVVDSSGNASDTLHITLLVVYDLTPPVITIRGAADTTILLDSTWKDPGATALDAVEGNLTAAIISSGVVNTEIVGSYTIHYRVQDNQGNASSETRTVHVRDIIAPVIENSQADKTDSCWEVKVQLRSVFTDLTTASDNYNSLGNGLILLASPAAPDGKAAIDTRFQGTTIVAYTATDSSGNVTTQCIKYVVSDNVINGPLGFYGESDSVQIRVNTPWVSTMRFRDSFDRDFSDSSMIMTSNLNIYALGHYWAKYVVTDSKGERQEKITYLEVVDDLKPIINSKNGGVVKILVNSIYDPIDHILVSDNYYPPAALRDSLVILFNDLDITTLGVYSTTFQTTDASGNISNEYTLITDVRLTLSTPNLEGSKIAKIYPNPVNDALYIKSSEQLLLSNISILDELGRKVNIITTKTYNGYFLDVSSLSAGLYSVKIRSDEKVQREKIIVR